MTNVERTAAEMELDERTRLRLAAELEHARRVLSECRRHHRRLPYQVQNALNAPPRVYDVDPPPELYTAARLV